MSNFDSLFEYFGADGTSKLSQDDRFQAFADHLEFLHLDALKLADEPRFLNVRARSPKNVWKSITIEVSANDFDERIEELWDLLIDEHRGWSWYTCTGLQRVAPTKPNGSGVKADSDAPWVAVFDIDIANDDGHKLDRLGDIDSTLDVIEFMEECLGRQFDAVWFTGGGVQGAVKLSAPLEPSDGALWEQLPAVYLEQHDIRMDRLATHGAQVVRLVGSENAKYEDEPVVRWLSKPRFAGRTTSTEFGDAVKSMLSDLGCTPPTLPNFTAAIATAVTPDEQPSEPVSHSKATPSSTVTTTASKRHSGRPGDRLNAIASPIEVLRSLANIVPSKIVGRYELLQADGTPTTGGGISIRNDGSLYLFSAKVADRLGMRAGVSYVDAFAVLTELYGEASAFTLADAIRYVEQQGQTTASVLYLLAANRTEAELRQAIGTVPKFAGQTVKKSGPRRSVRRRAA